MKFQVRDGFVVHLLNRVQIDDNRFETQEVNYYSNQVCDLTAEQAALHLHKLEPKDAKAAEYLASKVIPVAPATQLGVTPEMLALAQAMASEMVKAMLANGTAPTPAPAA